MSIPQSHIERYSQLALDELNRINSVVPAALLVSLWWSESKGKPGEYNKISRAAGIGQVTPIGLEFYNDSTASAVATADLRGTSSNSIAIQARVSAWLLNWNIRQAAQWTELKDWREIYLFGLLGYHQGWNAVKRRLSAIRKSGRPYSWANLAHDYPAGWKAKVDVFQWNETILNNARVVQPGKDEETGPAPINPAPAPVPYPIPPPEPIRAPAPIAIGIIGGLLALAGLIIAFIYWRKTK